jgi:hypothetical protein
LLCYKTNIKNNIHIKMENKNELVQLRQMIDSAESSLRSAKRVLAGLTGDILDETYSQAAQSLTPSAPGTEAGKVIQGIFTGEKMKAQSGEEYPVPANYASKSKLVPGDVLKLTIADDGRFLYKQISPTPRKSIVGTLVNDDGFFKVLAEDKSYKVLLASVTYFKGEVGDKVTLVVPEDTESEWGAIEAVLPADVTGHVDFMDSDEGAEEELEFGL